MAAGDVRLIFVEGVCARLYTVNLTVRVSLARLGGNITGLTVISGPKFYGKRLALLKETYRRVRGH